MKNFYLNQFGWTLMLEQGDIVFFKLNGFILSLYPSSELAKDIGIEAETGNFKQITTALLLPSIEDVNALFVELSAKNVTVIKSPEKAFWGGYSGYVADPENNCWKLLLIRLLKWIERVIFNKCFPVNSVIINCYFILVLKS
ncbi:MAG: VOC family protein [Bacteroidetes bacterium]|nr:VOC family protein [Bacteroidota bacterium]